MNIEIEKESLSEAGVQFGNLASRWNPKMKPYIAQKKGKLHLLNKQKIIDCFSYIKPQIEKMVEEDNATILFVGTSLHLSEIVKKAAISCQSPYFVRRWIGGFLTNFQNITRNISRLKKIFALQQNKKFTAFSKKKTARNQKKIINRFWKTYEGASDFNNEMPNVLFVIGLKKGKVAIKEAKSMNIPVIAICNTDADPDLIDYLVPGNDYTEKSVSFLVNKIAEVIRESKLRRNARLSAEENNNDNTEEKTKWISSKEINNI